MLTLGFPTTSFLPKLDFSLTTFHHPNNPPADDTTNEPARFQTT